MCIKYLPRLLIVYHSVEIALRVYLYSYTFQLQTVIHNIKSSKILSQI